MNNFSYILLFFQLQDAEDLPHQPASLLSFEAPIKEQRPAEITEGAYSVKKEELLLVRTTCCSCFARQAHWWVGLG